MAAQPDEADKIKLTYASDITKQVLTLADGDTHIHGDVP